MSAPCTSILVMSGNSRDTGSLAIFEAAPKHCICQNKLTVSKDYRKFSNLCKSEDTAFYFRASNGVLPILGR